MRTGGWRSERQVVITGVLEGGRRGWRLVVVSLRGVVTTQLAVAAVFDCGGEEVEPFDELCRRQRR